MIRNLSGRVKKDSGRRIALLAGKNSGGGLQRIMLNIGTGLLKRGYEVDFIYLSRKQKSDCYEWPDNIRLLLAEKSCSILKHSGSMLRLLNHDSKAANRFIRAIIMDKAIPGPLKYVDYLVDYLVTYKPKVLISGNAGCNILACMAKCLSGIKTTIILSEHNSLDWIVKYTQYSKKSEFSRLLPELISILYVHSDSIVSVSDGVADNLAKLTTIARDRITTIYNPIFDRSILDDAAKPAPHPWLEPGNPPVILGAGRLVKEKDFVTLIEAFSLLRRHQDARLIILGEGDERQALEKLARSLGIDSETHMPGWVSNPYSYMANSAVFVLSSCRGEGFGNVIVEAMACGCPVVSTDCPHGPSEILQRGKYGRLVPVGDFDGMAKAIVDTLRLQPEYEQLKSRAMNFSIDNALEKYIKLF